MKYRHEWKHLINDTDYIELKQRLKLLMQPDPHARPDGTYQIRSLYFDNLADKVLREKIDGVSQREKFRIRYYNGDPGLIHLEKKSKWSGLCAKESAVLTAAEAQAIADGKIEWMADVRDRPLVFELYRKLSTQGLRPKAIVDYTREPFVYPPGNVRVTLDHHIRTGLGCTDFLAPDCVTVPAGEPVIILEVKWDEYLPDLIRGAVQLKDRRVCAFSKYAASRIYG